MKSLPLAGLLSLAAWGANAQVAFGPPFVAAEPVVVTATRELEPRTPTLRDTIVITREELDQAGGLSLAEVLQRKANLELRATGGPGQPVGLFLRGGSPAQTLVLVDGLRVASATTGTAALESIPVELIERIEVVKGPMSSLYGSDAMAGVVQIFTRGKSVPHLFGSAAYGTDSDGRLAAGLTTIDGKARVALSAGARRVDAPSATNSRNTLLFDSDRDPHENGFANLQASYQMWQGETLALDAFGTRSRTHFDSGATGADDRNDQTISGVKVSSSNHFARDWASRLSYGSTLDKLQFHGAFEGVFETRQDQISWVNEFPAPTGSVVAGYEETHQHVGPDDAGEFSRTHRRIRSVFGSVNDGNRNQRVEANARRDDIEDFGAHNTGSLSYGYTFSPALRVSYTAGRGFRAPTFNDLYTPAIFGGNPHLQAESSKSRELAFAGSAFGGDWRLALFDTKFENLILFDTQSQLTINVPGARARGVEGTLSGKWLGFAWRGAATYQEARDEDTGQHLPSRADRLGSLEVSRALADGWSAGGTLTATGPRFDSRNEVPGSQLPGHAVLDLRLGYRVAPHWSAELVATNIADTHYETAVGYDAPRRGVLLTVRFDAF
jgi:vitamin B12 transporter